MQFILDNQPWILLISCFVLLAIVGYAAEKKNKRKQRDNIKEEVLDEEDDDSDEIEIEEEEPEETPEVVEEKPIPKTMDFELPAGVGPEAPVREEVNLSEISSSNFTTEPVVQNMPTDEPVISIEEDIAVPISSEPTAEVKTDDFGIDELPALRLNESNEENKDVWKF